MYPQNIVLYSILNLEFQCYWSKLPSSGFWRHCLNWWYCQYAVKRCCTKEVPFVGSVRSFSSSSRRSLEKDLEKLGWTLVHEQLSLTRKISTYLYCTWEILLWAVAPSFPPHSFPISAISVHLPLDTGPDREPWTGAFCPNTSCIFLWKKMI